MQHGSSVLGAASGAGTHLSGRRWDVGDHVGTHARPREAGELAVGASQRRRLVDLVPVCQLPRNKVSAEPFVPRRALNQHNGCTHCTSMCAHVGKANLNALCSKLELKWLLDKAVA